MYFVYAHTSVRMNNVDGIYVERVQSPSEQSTTCIYIYLFIRLSAKKKKMFLHYLDDDDLPRLLQLVV